MKKIGRELRNILDDSTSGGSELLSNINSYLKNNFNRIEDKDGLLSLLRSHFSDFPTVLNYIDRLERILRLKGDTESYFERQSRRRGLSEKIFLNSLPYLENFNKIITLSNSGTVFEVLLRLHSKVKNLRIYVSESRPLNEGRIMAEKFARAGIHVALITEASLSKYVSICDAAVIGADRILSDGTVVNKTGSNILAIIARYYDKPVFVLADRSKFADDEPAEKPKPPAEIWDTGLSNIEIENYYFEAVEADLIEKVITD